MLPQGALKTFADGTYVFFLVLSYCKVKKEFAVKSSGNFLLESGLHQHTAIKPLGMLLL